MTVFLISQNFVVLFLPPENLKRRDQLRDLNVGVGGRIILNCILKEQCEAVD